MDEPSEDGAESPTPGLARGKEHRAARVITNSAVVGIGQVLAVLIGLVMTPVIIANVGLSLFGIWGIITTAVSYLTVLDPGISGMIVRFGAIAGVQGDRTLLARLSSLGSLVWIALGLIFTPVLILVVPPFVHHIHIGTTSDAQVIAFFYWGYLLIVSDAIGSVINGQLLAVGDLWLASVIDIGTRFLYAGLLIIGFIAGWHLWAIIIASFAQTIVSYLVTAFLVWRRIGLPYRSPFRLERTMVRQVLRFGGWAQLAGILDTVTYNTDAVVTGAFVSAAATGVYSVANRIARQIPYFSTVPEAVLPAMSAAHGAGEGYPAIARISRRANRMACILAAGLASIILGAAPVLLAVWLGHQYPHADLATCIIAIGLTIGILQQTSGMTIAAIGKVGFGARARAVAFVVNIVATLALVFPFGLPGVLVGTVLATIVATSYLQIRLDRLLGTNARASIWSWALPLMSATAPAIILDRCVVLVLPASAIHHRGPALVALIVISVLNYTALVIGFRVARIVQPEDVSSLRNAMPGFLRRYARPWMTRVVVAPRANGA